MRDPRIQLQRILERIGIIVKRKNLNNCEWLRINSFLRHNRVDLILDVGANCGQYAHKILLNGFRGKIVSFEPQDEAHRHLTALAREFDDRWIVAERCAIGATNTTRRLFQTKGSASSSLRRPSGIAADFKEIYGVERSYDVKVRRLDDLVGDLGLKFERAFLKIDTQGSEIDVLAGSEMIMRKVIGLSIELSFREYYENQAMFDEVYVDVIGRGFEVWDLGAAWRDPRHGRLDHLDGVFFRNSV